MAFTTLNRLHDIYLFLILCLYQRLTNAQGTFALFLDFYCKTPSELAPAVSVPLSTCLVPTGAVSVAIQQFPSCEGGTASMIMYQDTSCALSTFSKTGAYTGWHGSNDNCFYLDLSDSIPGLMFTCEKPASNPQPTSTTTIVAYMVAGVATDHPSTSMSSTPAATNEQGSSSTSFSTISSTTVQTQATISSNSDGNSGSSGLSSSDKIAIGVGLGVGIPSILIGLAGLALHRRNRKKS